jgi:hypothetical protein
MLQSDTLGDTAGGQSLCQLIGGYGLQQNILSTLCIACPTETGSQEVADADLILTGSLPGSGCLRARTRTFAPGFNNSVRYTGRRPDVLVHLCRSPRFRPQARRPLVPC